jgi:hypothetical protein
MRAKQVRKRDGSGVGQGARAQKEHDRVIAAVMDVGREASRSAGGGDRWRKSLDEAAQGRKEKSTSGVVLQPLEISLTRMAGELSR